MVILDEVSAGFGGKVEQVEGCFKDIKVLTGDGLLEFVHEVRDDVARWSWRFGHLEDGCIFKVLGQVPDMMGFTSGYGADLTACCLA